MDEAATPLATNPLIGKIIDTVGKNALAMTFTTQRKQNIPLVVDALRQVYPQNIEPHP